MSIRLKKKQKFSRFSLKRNFALITIIIKKIEKHLKLLDLKNLFYADLIIFTEIQLVKRFGYRKQDFAI